MAGRISGNGGFGRGRAHSTMPIAASTMADAAMTRRRHLV